LSIPSERGDADGTSGVRNFIPRYVVERSTRLLLIVYFKRLK
jgi:hypothetical protein